MGIDNLLQNLLQLLLSYVEVDLQLQFVLGNASVYESKILRQNLIEDKSSQCRLYNAGDLFAALGLLRYANLDSGVKRTSSVLIC